MKRIFRFQIYEGWIVASSGCLLGFMVAALFFYGFGNIFNSLREEFGWSAAATAVAFSIRSESQSIIAPLVGFAFDKYGARKILIFGILLASFSTFMLARMDSLWEYYFYMLLISVGLGAAGGQVAQASVLTWFKALRSRAIGLVILGPGFAGLVVPGIAYLVNNLGWRTTLDIIALTMLVAGCLLAIPIRRRPADHPLGLDGIQDESLIGNDSMSHDEWGITLKTAFKCKSFFFVSFGQAACFVSTTGVIVHIIPYLEFLGYKKEIAALSITAFTLFSIIGRVSFAFLADKYSKRILLTLTSMILISGLPLLAFSTSALFACLATGIIGIGIGGTLPVRPPLLADYFGTKHIGAITGMSNGIATFGSAISPIFIGWMFDVTGTYQSAWLISMLFTAAAVPLFWFSKDPNIEMID